MISPNKVFGTANSAIKKQDIINGLLMAEAICSRKLIENFDKNGPDIVLSIMEDIVIKAIEELSKEETDE